MSLGSLTRHQAERVTQQLVRGGELAQERAQVYVDELLDRSRKQSDQLLALVRKEIRTQLTHLGLATKADLAALEARLRAELATASAATATAPGSTARAPKRRAAPAAPTAAPATGGPATAPPAKPGPAKAGPSKAGPSNAAAK